MKRIKRPAAALTALLLLCALFLLPAQAQEPVLTVAIQSRQMAVGDGGGAYADGEPVNVNAAFSEWYRQTYGESVTVNVLTCKTDAEAADAVRDGKADVAIEADYIAAQLIESGALAPLDYAEIPNYEAIEPTIRADASRYDPTAAYTVPYLWGYWGLVYNSDRVTGAVNDWGVLWDETHRGKILMPDNPRDAFAIALAYTGGDPNADKTAYWENAYHALAEQKPLVQAYTGERLVEQMTAGEADLAPCTYGDYLIMQSTLRGDDSVHLSFGTVTARPANRFVDVACVSAACENPPLAQRYINYLCSYEAGVANANFTGQASPMAQVRLNLEGDLIYHYASDPGVYPSDTLLSGMVSYQPTGERVASLMQERWQQLQRPDATPWLLIAIGAALAAVLITAALRVVQIKKTRKKPKSAAKGKPKKW